MLQAAMFSGNMPCVRLGNLQDCLMERYECDAEIKKLGLLGCVALDSASVDLLREIVVGMGWGILYG